MSLNLLYTKKNTKNEFIHDDDDYEYCIWRPKITNLIPPNKGLKYLLFTLFYYTHIFKNRNYFGVNLCYQQIEVASLLIVPTFFKWPFMAKQDVQVIYVMTKKEHRGKGLAIKMIKFALSKLPSKVDAIWYVTDENNPSSQRVAEKLDFKLNERFDKR